MLWICLIIIAIAALIHYFVRRPYQFFKERGIELTYANNPYVTIFKLITGRMETVSELKKMYDAGGSKRCFASCFMGINQIIVKDPELIRQVTVQNFDHYTDHVDTFFKEDSDPIIGRSLFALKGKRWHDMRTKLSPSFTGSKMRGMFMLMNDCGLQLVSYLQKLTDESPNNQVELDFRKITSKFTNDMIATTAFGVKIDSFANPDNEFYKTGSIITKLPVFKFIVMALLPKLSKMLGMKLFMPEVYEFLSKTIVETMAIRERENITRPDMLQLLIEARNSQKKNKGDETVSDLTDEDIVSQSLLFFLAGFDTVSVTMCFAIYELTINPEIQQTLQKEVDSIDGGLTYDKIMKMKYLDMVVSETLRKYPPAVQNDRVCVKAHQLNVKEADYVAIEPGMAVNIPTYWIHHDPNWWPNPDKFDPERFNVEVAAIEPYTYLPFGVGPRMCIGNRFALLETKVLLFHLLKNFGFEVIARTSIPMVFKTGPTNLDSKNGFWTGLKARSN